MNKHPDPARLLGMQIVDFLRCIRDGKTLSDKDMETFIHGIVEGTVLDYQAAAFLMAVYHMGLSDSLTVAMTLAMRDSGDVITHPEVGGMKVDKHSTGGVGDKISIPLAPLVASCGVVVPMISGRGLGHTGGTLDKLEAIPGFQVNLGIDRFKELLGKHGVCLIGQTDRLAPADRKLYALRDVTATVESIPLITASILSKKLAEGIDALVLDVKVGAGAFMKTEASARALAQSLITVGKGAGLKTVALLTRMDDPLGRTIGNALEIRESIEILRGDGPQDTTELTLELGSAMLVLGGVAKDSLAGRTLLKQAIDSGRGLEKFAAIIEAQGGDPTVVETLAPTDSPHVVTVPSGRGRFVQSIDSYGLELGAMHLGAGRSRTDDVIDPAVGIEVLCKRGEKVSLGQPLARVHARQADPNLEAVSRAFCIEDRAVLAQELIIGRLG
ncbi:MAG: thymidine phosphorylase [Myxococcota bacterium]